MTKDKPINNAGARLSVVLMVKNEAANLLRALKSVEFADEIIVADTGSTDDTVRIAEQFSAKVIHCDWSGFGPTKATALSHAAGEWILSLDADEEITPELAEDIRGVVHDSGNTFAAYRLSRQSYFLGRWM